MIWHNVTHIVTTQVIMTVLVLRVTLSQIQDSVMVVVDGGEAVLAPDTLGLSAGAHSILFKKKGHYKKKITLTVPADSILEQAVVLRAPAVLLIDAGVDSARVLINKKPVGRTPFRSKPLRPGSYDIMIVKSGYERHTATVTLGSGEEETLAVALKSTAPIVDTSVVETEKTTPDTLPNAPKKESPREKKIARAIAGAVFTLFIGMIAAFEISNGGE